MRHLPRFSPFILLSPVDWGRILAHDETKVWPSLGRKLIKVSQLRQTRLLATVAKTLDRVAITMPNRQVSSIPADITYDVRPEKTHG
jgi:hypothetical protein